MLASLVALAALLAGSVVLATPHHRALSFNRPSFEYMNAGAKHTARLGDVHQGYPSCDPGVNQMSGYFNINTAQNKNYFYWAFESKGNPLIDPVILWMTGGPGCSSSLATLVENGPCHINMTTGELYSNPYSWNNAATIIYIDQPAGVGFSYADYPSGYDYNETMVAEDMYWFLQAFYTAFPQYLSNDFFVYGESYGGHFAPATAHRVWEGIQKKQGLILPLKGLSVGNGMTDPQVQFSYYSHLAYQWCRTVKGAPCINETTYQGILAAEPVCTGLIAQCNGANGGNNTACVDALNYCSNNIMGPYFNTGLNVYDIRVPCWVPGLCYNFTFVHDFMNSPAVQSSLGVLSQNITWHSCNMQVNGMFSADWTRNFQQLIPDLLKSNIRVLIYSGDMDFICNWLGNKAWTLELPWSGQTSFAATHDKPWYVDEVEAGMFRTVSNAKVNMLFNFVQIHGAGHMVPMDQPKRALRMVQHFISDTPFYGYGS